jgi:integrase
MPRLKLTDKFIRNVTCRGDGRVEYMDTVVPQLMLRVTSSRHKSFNLLARFPNFAHPTRRKLGDFYDGDPSVLDQPDPGILDRPGAALSLAEARDKARIWLGLIARGRDIGAERKAAAASIKAKETAQREAAKNVFERVASAWVARKCSGLKQELEIDRLIEREFTSRWKGRPIADIGKDEYRQAVRAIEERGAGAQAYNALGHLRRLLAWAGECGEFGSFTSPLRDVRPASWIDAKRVERSRVLSPDELRAVWQAAVTMGYPWGDCIRLLALSGQRLREIADLSWPEIDMDQRLATIPANRMKSGAAHELPLAPYALALIESLPRWPGKFVFSVNGGTRSIGGFNRAKEKLDALSGVTDWVIHDVRRSARSGFSALSAEDHVRECVIAHRRAGIKGTYDLHLYRAEKLAVLAAWESRLAAIVAAPAVDMREAAE